MSLFCQMFASKQSIDRTVKEIDEHYLLVDTSAQLTHRKFRKDLDAVVARSRDSGVNKIVLRATNGDNSRDALRLCRLYPETLYCSAGIAPNEASNWSDTTRDVLQELLANPECVAVGESGLDLARDHCPPATQLDVFESSLILSKTSEKPILAVIRNAHSEALDLMKRYSCFVPNIVLHSFQGSESIVTKDKCDVTRLLANQTLPLSRVLLESDCPWNLPNARSSRLSDAVKSSLTERSLGFLNRYCTFNRNEPCSLPATNEIISAICGLTAHEVALQTTYNALKVFGLTSSDQNSNQ